MKITTKQNSRPKLFGLRSLGLLLFAILAALLVGSSALFLMPAMARAENAATNDNPVILTLEEDEYGLTIFCLSVSTTVTNEFDVWNLTEVNLLASGGSSIVPLKKITTIEIFEDTVRLSILDCAPLSVGTYVITLKGLYTGVGTEMDEVFTATVNYTVKPIPLPTEPTKEGHHFVGWYLDEALTIPYNGEPITSPTDVYPKFEINRYMVSFKSDGALFIPSIMVDWNTVATSLPTPERNGHDFAGWYLGDTVYTDQVIKQDTTLRARWTVKMFPVTFYLNGEVFDTINVPYGSVLSAVMTEAQIANFKAFDMVSGMRVSKNSVITEDTAVLITELSGWEKFGDYVAQNHWVTWAVLVLLVLLAGAVIVLAVIVNKKG